MPSIFRPKQISVTTLSGQSGTSPQTSDTGELVSVVADARESAVPRNPSDSAQASSRRHSPRGPNAVERRMTLCHRGGGAPRRRGKHDVECPLQAIGARTIHVSGCAPHRTSGTTLSRRARTPCAGGATPSSPIRLGSSHQPAAKARLGAINARRGGTGRMSEGEDARTSRDRSDRHRTPAALRFSRLAVCAPGTARAGGKPSERTSRHGPALGGSEPPARGSLVRCVIGRNPTMHRTV
jgi:hypothetical protein